VAIGWRVYHWQLVACTRSLGYAHVYAHASCAPGTGRRVYFERGCTLAASFTCGRRGADGSDVDNATDGGEGSSGLEEEGLYEPFVHEEWAPSEPASAPLPSAALARAAAAVIAVVTVALLSAVGVLAWRRRRAAAQPATSIRGGAGGAPAPGAVGGDAAAPAGAALLALNPLKHPRGGGRSVGSG
jgi:hypothetical protein